MSFFKFYLSPTTTNSLEERLKKLSSRYLLKWIKAKKIITIHINKQYAKVFLDFSGKASDHGDQGVAFFNASFPEEFLQSLNSAEIFLLMAGCYLHDIGFISETKPYKLLDHKLHYTLGQKIINQRKWLPFTQPERKVLGCMARWHNKSLWEKEGSIQEQEIIVDNMTVRTMLLVQLLQLADQFHRVIDVKWKNFKEFSDK